MWLSPVCNLPVFVFVMLWSTDYCTIHRFPRNPPRISIMSFPDALLLLITNNTWMLHPVRSQGIYGNMCLLCLRNCIFSVQRYSCNRCFVVNTARDHRLHSNTPLLWLHNIDGIHLLAADRHNRLLRRVLLHPKDLCCHQDRLEDSVTYYSRLWHVIVQHTL